MLFTDKQGDVAPNPQSDETGPSRPEEPAIATAGPSTRARTPCPQTVARAATGRTAADRAVALFTPTI